MHSREADVKKIASHRAVRALAPANNDDTAPNSRSYQSNNNKDLTELYELLYSNIYFFARRFVTKEEAADITAEAFYKFYKAGINFKSISVAKNYLQVSVRNGCLNLLAEKKRDRKRDEDLSFLREEIQDDYSEIQSALVNIIRAEIDKLPTQCRRVFILRYIEGKKHGEIAKIMNISPNTVKNYQIRAKELLKYRLKILEPFLILLVLLHR